MNAVPCTTFFACLSPMFLPKSRKRVNMFFFGVLPARGASP